MDPTLFSLQHFSDSTSPMVRRRKMAARSGERLVVGDISMYVRALACLVHCLGGFMGKDDLAEANRCYRTHDASGSFLSVLIGSHMVGLENYHPRDDGMF